jgi:parallel beta-helix repeat protein
VTLNKAMWAGFSPSYPGFLKNPCKGKRFVRTYHVNNTHPQASDSNSGESNKPLATISGALQRAMPGDLVLVLSGTYRETLEFVRGGQSADKPITLKALEDQNVSVLGSEVSHRLVPGYDKVWVKQGWTVNSQQVFCNGQPLTQIGYSNPFHEMTLNGEPVLPARGSGLKDMFPGSFWYDAEMGSLYVWLPDGSSPSDHFMEASVREYIIAPNSLDHIHIQGFIFAHSNTSVLGKDESMVNLRGNNWKIQDCQFLLADMGALSLEGEGHLVEKSSFILNGSHGISINQLDTEGDWTGQDEPRTRNITLRVNETSYNNIRDFSHNWKSGGIRALDSCLNISIEEHQALDNKGAGIWFDAECRDISITRSLFKDNFAGIIADKADEISINNSIFADNTFGMGILSTSQANIQFNTFHQNHSGLTVEMGQEKRPMNYNTIMNNLFNKTATVDLSLLVTEFGSNGNLSDYNAYARDDHELNNEWTDGNTVYKSTSLRDFQSRTGMDYNSLPMASLWTGKSEDLDYIPPSGSALLDAAFVDNSVGDLDFHGRVRDKKRDIGAVEYVAALDSDVRTYHGTDKTQEQEQKTDDSDSVVVEEELFFLTVESGTGSGQYKAGQKVIINANMPADGKEFSQWSGDIAYLEDMKSSSTTVTMPEKEVFVAASYEEVIENEPKYADGNVYYVSPKGNDSNPGTKEKPWQTLKKAGDTALAGDIVYIREGVYKGPLVPRNSGTKDKWITFKGVEGEKVVIEGGYEVTGWKQHKGSIYSASWKSSWLEAEWETASMGGSKGFVNIDNGTTSEHWPRPALDPNNGFVGGVEYMHENSWYYDKNNQILYLWMAGNANPSNHTVYSTQSWHESFAAIYVTPSYGYAYLRFENLETRLAYRGVETHTGGVHNIEIKNLEIYNVHVGIVNNHSSSDFFISNCHIHHVLGVGIQNNGNYATIENCEIHDIGFVTWDRWANPGVILMGAHNVLRDSIIYDTAWVGIFFESWKATSGDWPDRCHHNIVENNLVRNPGGPGIQISGGDYNIVRNNIVQDSNYGGFHLYRGHSSDVEIRKAYNNRIYNNTFIDNSYANIYVGQNTYNTEIYNNIIYELGTHLFVVSEGDLSFISDYNCYYRINGFSALIRGNPHVSYKSLTDWRAAKGGDGSSIYADPLFNNINENDFSLKERSPCIDAGKVLDGIEYNNSPNIGAIQ